MSEQQGNYDIEKRKREFAVLRKYAAIQKATEEKMGCQKIYVDIAGGIIEAFILDELIFFTLPRPETGKSGLRVWKEGMLWMAVSRTEWWVRKRITAKQADGAIERLVKDNLIFKDYFLFNKQKTTHLRLNVSKFFERYTEELEKQNPPEDESDTTHKDIQDLYEMLGIPVKDTPEGIPEGEAGIPEGEAVSLNGDSINSPDTSLTQPSFDEEKADLGWSLLDGKKITKKQIEKQKQMIVFEEMLETQFKRFPLNWTAFDEKAKENFRKFIQALPEGQSLERFVDWWMSDEKRVSCPPYTLAIIMQRFPQAFVNQADTRPEHRPHQADPNEGNYVPNPYQKSRILSQQA